MSRMTRRGHGVELRPGAARRGGAVLFLVTALTAGIAFALTHANPFSMSLGFAEGENAAKTPPVQEPAAAQTQEAPAASATVVVDAGANASAQEAAAEGAAPVPAAVEAAPEAAAAAAALEDPSNPAVKSYLEVLKLYKNLQQDQDNILSQLRIAYTERDKAKGDIQIYKDQSEQAAADKKEIQKANAELKKVIKPLETKVAQLEKKTAQLEAQSIADKEKIGQLSELLKGSEALKLREELKTKQAEFSSEKARLQQMIDTANRDRETVKQRHFSSEKRIHDLEIELAQLTANYEKAIEENRSLHARFTTIEQKMMKISEEKEKAIKETASMHYNLGVFYTQQKDFPRALEEFKKAADWRPNDAQSHYNLGIIYSEYLIDHEKAKSSFQRYLELQPEAKDRNYVESVIKSISYSLGKSPAK